MLGQFADYRRIFIEVTKTAEHGGRGWEFGTCLWSPTSNKAGQSSYRLMREPEIDDLVLHVQDARWQPGVEEHRLVGESRVSSRVEARSDEPPQAGEWTDQGPYYRVPLADFTPFREPISIAAFIELYERELRKDLAGRAKYHPFTLYDNGSEVRLRQGGYINTCTPGLFELIRKAVGDGPLPPRTPQLPLVLPPSGTDEQYKETKRLVAERFAFARNPGLVKAARELRGFECEACDFDFEAKYGELGREYIECHHVDPLGRREGPVTTTAVDDVRMVCSNCHRMVHRSRPAMAVEDLRLLLGLPPRPPIPGL